MKETGLPFAEGLDSAADLPYTISFAILYRSKIDSFGKLPKDKQPPRNLWDKPYRLEQFLDHIWDKDEDKAKSSTYIDIPDDEEFE